MTGYHDIRLEVDICFPPLQLFKLVLKVVLKCTMTEYHYACLQGVVYF